MGNWSLRQRWEWTCALWSERRQPLGSVLPCPGLASCCGLSLEPIRSVPSDSGWPPWLACQVPANKVFSLWRDLASRQSLLSPGWTPSERGQLGGVQMAQGGPWGRDCCVLLSTACSRTDGQKEDGAVVDPRAQPPEDRVAFSGRVTAEAGCPGQLGSRRAVSTPLSVPSRSLPAHIHQVGRRRACLLCCEQAGLGTQGSQIRCSKAREAQHRYCGLRAGLPEALLRPMPRGPLPEGHSVTLPQPLRPG